LHSCKIVDPTKWFLREDISPSWREHPDC